MTAGEVDAIHFWPTAELGSVVQLREAILPVAEAFRPPAANSIEFLERRARDIDKLMENVWAKR